MVIPYTEHKINNQSFIRIFDDNIDESELVWHRDYETRFIKVIENTNWKFQFDNELPFLLSEDFIIPKETHHRLLKGNGKFIVEITEFE